MHMYENPSEEDQHDYESTTNGYEQPLPKSSLEAKKTEGLYFEPDQCRSPPTVSDNTSRSNTDETGFKSLEKKSTDANLKFWLGILTVLVILCIAGIVATVVMYVKANEATEGGKVDVTLIKESLTNLRTEIRQYQEDRNLDFKKQLKIYYWYKARNAHWYKLFRARASYGDARGNCAALGARLASVGIRNTTIKNDLVAKLVKSGISHTWIGLDDLQQPLTWVWSDGALSTVNNTQWKAGNLNKEGGNQRCGHLFESRSWPINNQECNKLYSYICETKEPL